MTTALNKARRKYEKKRRVKRVSFLLKEDKEILEYAESIPFSEKVKELLLSDLKKKKSGVKENE